MRTVIQLFPIIITPSLAALPLPATQPKSSAPVLVLRNFTIHTGTGTKPVRSWATPPRLMPRACR
jgi:hypothetical protein